MFFASVEEFCLQGLSKERSHRNIATLSSYVTLVTPERLADLNHSNDAALQIEAVKCCKYPRALSQSHKLFTRKKHDELEAPARRRINPPFSSTSFGDDRRDLQQECSERCALAHTSRC